MPRGLACHARGVSRRVLAPWEAGFAGAGGTGMWARYPFPDSQAGRARPFQQNIRLEKERSSQPNENTVRIPEKTEKPPCDAGRILVSFRRFKDWALKTRSKEQTDFPCGRVAVFGDCYRDWDCVRRKT